MGEDVIKIDHKLTNGSIIGWLLRIEIQEDTCKRSEQNNERQIYDYIRGHIRHPNEKVTKMTAKKLGIKEQNNHLSINCTINKTRKKNIPKSSGSHA